MLIGASDLTHSTDRMTILKLFVSQNMPFNHVEYLDTIRFTNILSLSYLRLHSRGFGVLK